MHTSDDVTNIYNNFMAFIHMNFVLNGFILGFSISMFLLLIIVCFIQHFPILIIILISFLSSLFFGFYPSDMTQLMDFLDIPISLIATFLFLRLIMSLTRSIEAQNNLSKTTIEGIILFISFCLFCLSSFIVYNTFEKNYLAYIVYFINTLILIIQVLIDNGNLADACFVITYSILFFSTSTKLSTFISVFRIVFIILSIISLIDTFHVVNQESLFLIFRIERKKVRFLLMLGVGSYFYVSPRLMWNFGDERCTFQAIAAPILYLVLLIYEHFNVNDDNFYGYG